MLQTFKLFLQGPDGEQSSKRLFTLVLMTLWVAYFVANLFWGKRLDPVFEEQLFYMILFFYAGITAESWKSVFQKSNTLTLPNATR